MVAARLHICALVALLVNDYSDFTDLMLTLCDNSTLLTSSAGLERAKSLITDYKQGKIAEMNPELWTAKKTIDSTLHPG